jgi:hypothetical protein
MDRVVGSLCGEIRPTDQDGPTDTQSFLHFLAARLNLPEAAHKPEPLGKMKKISHAPPRSNLTTFP